MQKVLCLGAGLVARPYIQYLCKHGFHVIVASRTKSKAERLIEGCKSAEAVALNIKTDDELLDKLVAKADLTCSLLPYTYHVKAAKLAIKYRKPFCTTSYISDEMQALDDEAKKARILVLNECGVDPGIDHMSAMKIIDDIHNKGGKVISFTSYLLLEDFLLLMPITIHLVTNSLGVQEAFFLQAETMHISCVTARM
jgi:saccharopine dehydrogenase (NADP+, L-glutamate forming)/spermidine synthase